MTPTPQTVVGSETSLDLRTPTPIVSSVPVAPLQTDAAEKTAVLLEKTTGVRTIAIAQIATDPGCLKKNLEKIVDKILDAKKQGADIVVFPELTIPGYNHMDLANNDLFIWDQTQVINALKEVSHGIAIVVGCIRAEPDRFAPNKRRDLKNSAIVIRNGEIIHSQDKQLLPDYGIHYETRYFRPGSLGQKSTFEIDGVKLGLSICEDMWTEDYPVDPIAVHEGAGEALHINISGSPFVMGKVEQRKEILKTLAKRVDAPVVFANLVGSFDGFESEVVFDGRSMIIGRDGEVKAMAKGFQEDLLLYDIHQPKQFDIPVQEEIHELHDALILGIREYFRRNGFSRAYIGLSGGIDSAVVAALAVEALGAENVIGVTMPSHVTSSETKDDAHRLAANLGIKCIERSIREEYSAWLDGFREANDHEPERLTKQNKQARIRGSILMEYTNEDRGSICISTGNKTELALGYCTLYGDMCGGFAAISDVDKLRVYALAEYANLRARREIIPRTTIQRLPTAELEENQTDKDNLPADYDVLAPLVNEIVEDRRSREELIHRYPEEVVDRTFRLIQANEFKRRQAAPGIRVSKLSFGVERRMPMGQMYFKSEFAGS